MKQKQLKIQIPEPCHEDWNKMTPKDQGAFCSSCSKVVVDFTKMTDRELINYFENKKSEKTCGRFTKFQVGREMVASQPTPSHWLRMKNVLLGFFFSLSLPGFLKAEKVINRGNPMITLDQDQLNFPSKISGVVKDENGKGIPFAIVAIVRNGEPVGIGATTDFNGSFSIDLSELKDVVDLKIKVSYIGYETKVFELTEQESYSLNLVPDTRIRLLEEQYIVGKIPLIDANSIEHNTVNAEEITKLPTRETGNKKCDIEYLGQPLVFDDNKQNDDEETLVSHRIKGNVSGGDGEALAFANVRIMDTEFGTTTDIDGNFDLVVPEELRSRSEIILQFSYIGFEDKEMTISEVTGMLSIILNELEYEHVLMGIVIPSEPQKVRGEHYLELTPKWQREGFHSREAYKEFKKSQKGN